MDPTGHETSKPEWWPPFLPWTFDLPDDISHDAFVQWASENNIPTVLGGQIGVDASGGVGAGGTFSTEFQWTFNWWSGELAYLVNVSGGGRAGTPEASVAAHFGATWITGASRTEKSVVGPYLFGTVDGGAQAIGKIGGTGTWTRAQKYQDTNGNGQFDLMNGVSEPLDGPLQDPVFQRTVDGLSLNLAAGYNAFGTPPASGGISTGVGDTNRIAILDVYGPLRLLSNLGGQR